MGRGLRVACIVHRDTVGVAVDDLKKCGGIG